MEITLAGNNVFRNGQILLFDNGEGMIIRDTIEFTGESEDMYHTVKMNDRLDLLAYNFYSSRVEDASKFWWVIADANSIENPLDLTEFVGKNILIPNIMNALLAIQEE